MTSTPVVPSGEPPLLRWALHGLDQAASSRYGTASADELREWVDCDVSDAAVDAVIKFNGAKHPERLAKGVQRLDVPRDCLVDAMEAADTEVRVLGSDSMRPGKFRYEYVADLLVQVDDADSSVYMCKTVNGDKAMMAWDLDSDNVIAEVDNYDKFEILGWELLKDFPHGEHQIREKYGDCLSDSVLQRLCGGNGSTATRSSTSPSTETLTISTGRREFERFKKEAEDVKDEFNSGGAQSVRDVRRLILFPSDTDRNLSDNWWIVGPRANGGSIGFANCNKGTWEFLSDCDQALHVDNYIESAEEYEVVTSAGATALGDLELDNCVVYVTSDESYPRMTRDIVLDNLPRLVAERCDDRWKSPDLDGDEIVIVLSPRDAFPARPLLYDAGRVVYTDSQIRDIGADPFDIGHEYSLYAEARLADWDWSSPELTAFKEQCWNLEMDDGGYELVETLATLHDNGKPLYSESPRQRWDDGT